jgi:hypothetical protein
MSSEASIDSSREGASSASAPELHQSFLFYRRFFFLKVAGGLVILSSLVYLIDNPRGGPNGGTWLGYTLGTIAAGIIVWLTWFGWRKRTYAATRARLGAWLSAHVYLGLSLIVVATLHCAFEFGYNVHTLAYVLMMLVIASGVYGIFAYARYPRLMTQNRRGTTQTQVLGQIASLDGEIRQALLGMDDAIVRVVAPAIEHDNVGGSVWRQLSAHYPDCSTAAALQGFTALEHSMPVERREEMRNMPVLLTRKSELLQRLRRDVQYKAMMDIWLYVHVPLTFALLAALAAHIISVFFYW